MAKAKSVKSPQARKKAPAAPRTAAQEALEVTWVLKGHLKNAQIAYLRVGALLAQVRDRKLYADLGHPDLESYAEQRLHLGRASLYRYLQVYDWVSTFHKEWIEPKPQGFIPDLNDVADLIWIEQELTRKDLDAKKRNALEALRQQALDGRLRKGALAQWRRQGRRGEETLRSFLSKLRRLRMRGAQLACMPVEVITHLDMAIELLKNAQPTQLAGLDFLGSGPIGRMA
jgi:hypothetical protein